MVKCRDDNDFGYLYIKWSMGTINVFLLMSKEQLSTAAKRNMVNPICFENVEINSKKR